MLRETGIYTRTSLRCRQDTTYAIDESIPPLGHASMCLVAGDAAGVEGGIGFDSNGSARPIAGACPHCNRQFAPVPHEKHTGIDTGQTFAIDNATDWCALWPAVFVEAPLPVSSVVFRSTSHDLDSSP